MPYADTKRELTDNGFAIVENIYSAAEISTIITEIENVDKDKPTFRITNDLFAIRQFLKELPGVFPFVFNQKLKNLIAQLFGDDYFIAKSIYFDKPGDSNWFVGYHQDLTISVDKKVETKDFGPWTVKHNQFAVQPPLNILKENFTVRVHLDDTNSANGALKVVPSSHLKDIYRPETINWNIETETVCEVPAGGVMLMSPLLLHASSRTINNKKRRVIHIEFAKAILSDGLNWSEKVDLFV